MPSPLDRVKVNLFRGSVNTRPVKVLSVAQVLDAIQDGTYQRPVRRLRDLLQTGDKAGYDMAKRRLDALTFAGTFAPTRAKANLTLHTGIIHGDLDHLTDLQAAKHTLTADPHVVYCFVSPSGAGLKVGVASDPVADDGGYKAAWQTIADAHQRDYGLMWDRSGKDVSRLCYVSFDPKIYVNATALLFPVPVRVDPPPRPPTPPCRPWPISADRRARYAEQAIQTAVAIIDASIPGSRHHHRLRASTLIGGYVGGGVLSYDEAYAALEAAVARNTDDLGRSLKTIADGLRHGQARPISLEELEAERRDWIERHRPSRTGYRPFDILTRLKYDGDYAAAAKALAAQGYGDQHAADSPASDPWDGTSTLPLRPYRGRYYPRTGREVSHG